MRLYTLIHCIVMVFLTGTLSAAEEVLCQFKNPDAELEIIRFYRTDENDSAPKALSVVLKNIKTGSISYHKNSGLLMGCIVEGLASPDRDNTIIMNDQFSVRFLKNGLGIVISSKIKDTRTSVSLTRAQAVELIRIISKYYGFPISGNND